MLRDGRPPTTRAQAEYAAALRDQVSQRAGTKAAQKRQQLLIDRAEDQRIERDQRGFQAEADGERQAQRNREALVAAREAAHVAHMASIDLPMTREEKLRACKTAPLTPVLTPVLLADQCIYPVTALLSLKVHAGARVDMIRTLPAIVDQDKLAGEDQDMYAPVQQRNGRRSVRDPNVMSPRSSHEQNPYAQQRDGRSDVRNPNTVSPGICGDGFDSPVWGAPVDSARAAAMADNSVSSCSGCSAPEYDRGPQCNVQLPNVGDRQVQDEILHDRMHTMSLIPPPPQSPQQEYLQHRSIQTWDQEALHDQNRVSPRRAHVMHASAQPEVRNPDGSLMRPDQVADAQAAAIRRRAQGSSIW